MEVILFLRPSHHLPSLLRRFSGAGQDNVDNLTCGQNHRCKGQTARQARVRIRGSLFAVKVVPVLGKGQRAIEPVTHKSTSAAKIDVSKASFSILHINHVEITRRFNLSRTVFTMGEGS